MHKKVNNMKNYTFYDKVNGRNQFYERQTDIPKLGPMIFMRNYAA